MPKVYNKRHKDVPKDAIYVGRPSKYGNPFIIGVHGNRDTVIRLFCRVIDHMMIPFSKQSSTLSIDFGNDEANNWTLDLTTDDIKWLRGKDLVCWCAPAACHADYLLKIANEESNDE